MTISAKVVADTWYAGSRLTTFELVYPRFIHSEVMTHRQFSRNAASSRAIPVETMLRAVQDNPAMPVFWGKNQRGMQAAEELDAETIVNARVEWCMAMRSALGHAKALADMGVHKQIANRVLEPWMHMTTLVSATEWANFYALRTDAQAQPEFRALAEAMLAAHNASVPVKSPDWNPVVNNSLWTYWHLPYVTAEEQQTLGLEDAKKVSVARCARTSYARHGQVKDLEDDLQLHDRLAAAGHWSPFEHQAVASFEHQDGNFWNFKQYRKFFPTEVFRAFPRLLDPFRSRSLDTQAPAGVHSQAADPAKEKPNG